MVDFFFMLSLHSCFQAGRIIASSAVSAACRVPTCRYDNSPLTTGTPVRRIGTRGPPCRPALALRLPPSALALRLLFHSADALGLRAVVPYHSRCSRSASPPAPPLDLAARRSPLAAAAPPLLAWLLPVATTSSTKYGWATREQ